MDPSVDPTGLEPPQLPAAKSRTLSRAEIAPLRTLTRGARMLPLLRRIFSSSHSALCGIKHLSSEPSPGAAGVRPMHGDVVPLARLNYDHT